MHASRIALVVASSLGMLCTFLPWVNGPLVGSIAGSSGDGWISFVLCGAALVCALVGNRRFALSLGAIIVSALCGVAACLLGVWKIVQFKDLMAGNPFGDAFSIGAGLYLLVISGAVIALLPPILSLSRPATPVVPYQHPQAWQPPPQAYWPQGQQPGPWEPPAR